MLRTSLSRLIAILLLLTAGATPAVATWSAKDDATPGAASSAGFRGKLYIFARNADNSLKYRTADGRIYSGWKPLPIGGSSPSYPAAVTATDGSFLALFIRGTDHNLYVTRTFDGTSFEPWRAVGGAVSAAPSAVAFNGRIHVFVRLFDNSLYTRHSTDAVNWSNWLSLGSPWAGGPDLAGAPVATVMRRSDSNRPFQIVVIVKNAVDGKLYQRTSLDGTTQGSFTPWFKRSDTTLGVNPADEADFPIVADLGFNFISPYEPEGSWESYKLPVFSTAQAQLAKFNLFFDSSFPNPSPSFSAQHIQNVIDRGAITIILRLADTKISDGEVKQQLEAVLPGLEGPRNRVIDFIEGHPYQQFWIEVGNEPNLGCNAMDPFDVRWHLLNTMRNVAPLYRASHPNMRWIASLPTRHGFNPDRSCPHPVPPGCPFPLPPPPMSSWPPECKQWSDLNYLDIVLSDTHDGLGTILSGEYEYDAVGIHMFGNSNLQPDLPVNGDHNTQNGTVCRVDSDCPTVVLDRVLARTAKTIFITEAAINADLKWYYIRPEEPGFVTLHIRAMRRLPAQVRGYVIWAADLERKWCDRSLGQPAFVGPYSFDATYVGGNYCTFDPDLKGSRRFNDR